MRAPPADLSERQVAGMLLNAWGLRADRLSYVPEGGGSYHWRADLAAAARYFLTVDDLRSKPWLGPEPESAFAGLRVAFDTALALGGLAHLSFVVPPVPASDGATVHRLTGRYSLAVFRFVEGLAGSWGDQVSPEERDELIALIAELHLATPVAAGAVRRGLELHYRADLESALAALRLPWTGGPYSELARQALAANAGNVRAMLAAYDRYSASLLRKNASCVVTHGEPHPGNFMRTAGGPALIDWDTVALALPERDLWMLDDGSPGGLAAYQDVTGRQPDRAAISCYRLAWTLTDLAAFTCLLRSEHEQNADTEHAWRALSLVVRPGSPSRDGPYRHAAR